MIKITRQLQQLSLNLHKERGQRSALEQLVNMVTSPQGARSLSAQRYEDAVATLNSLQSNAAYLKEAKKVKRSRSEEAWKLAFTRTYLELIGVTSKDLSNLSVIHVAGTKGKGSTSAYCESILRKHGFRTGFFSSPHLVAVRERIRIDGKPISTSLFSDFFWDVFNTISEKRDSELEMPSYFIFLTLMAFKIFLSEMVDVAIVEVGIGGEFDSTNVLNNVSVVGITSLGIDHTALLGNTMSSIAWQKAGILKPSAVGFTVPGHCKEALEVLAQRSKERKCPLKIAPSLEKYSWPDEATKQKVLSLLPTQQLNASLALQLANAWMRKNACPSEKESISTMELAEAHGFKVSTEMSQGLLSCRWPGRNQVLVSACGRITYYIDGAHTQESVEACAEWFNNLSSSRPKMHRALILNLTGDRDGSTVFKPLLSCKFDMVTFSPNVAYVSVKQGDSANLRVSQNEQLSRIQELSELWNSMCQTTVNRHSDNLKYSSCSTCVAEALAQIEASEGEWGVLVTGSLHLVGALLSILDPKLEKSESASETP